MVARRSGFETSSGEAFWEIVAKTLPSYGQHLSNTHARTPRIKPESAHETGVNPESTAQEEGMMRRGYRGPVREFIAGWSAEDALCVRRTLRSLHETLDAAFVALALGEDLIDYQGEFESGPSSFARYDGPGVSLTAARTRDGERRSIATTWVRPGFGSRLRCLWLSMLLQPISRSSRMQ